MYLFVTVGLMVLLPVLSVLQGLVSTPGSDVWLLVGKWFTFWGIGVRLLVAGASQVLRPGFTAEGIFGLKDPGAGALVRELGFANLSLGLIGTISLFQPAFVLPAAIAGGLFLCLDGLQHLRRSGRTGKETLAMITDLILAVAIGAYLVRVLT